MSIIKLNNNAVKNVTSFGNVGSGSMTLIKKLTASSSATLSFVDGSSSVVLDNTYKEYIFYFFNMHPATNNAEFLFNLSSDSGSNYNITKTSSFFTAYHNEDGSDTQLYYVTSSDLAQSTNFQRLLWSGGNDNDHACSGFLHLFDPSNTSHVKHFIGRTASTMNHASGVDYALDHYVAGYGNTTSAIDAVQFKMDTGNIDSGNIVLYGIN